MDLHNQFEREGYIVVRNVLSDSLLAEARKATDELIAGLPPATRMEAILFPHVDPKHWTAEQQSGACSSHHDFFLRLAAEPKLLDIVEALLGQDIVLFSTHLFAKSPFDGWSRPWHQDGYYYDVDRPDQLLTMWLAFDESTTANGCLEVYPRSHTLGLLEHRKVYVPHNGRHSSVLDPSGVPGCPVPILLQPGDCSVHHSLLVHGSPINKSPRRRAGHTMTYMSARTHVRSRVFRESPYPLYLLRGRASPGVNSYIEAGTAAPSQSRDIA
jgi:ectoine hydroxylase-related dioxygenase (phytanoyl-CoA dioxygenase family)